jgi:hypothetical protein
MEIMNRTNKLKILLILSVITFSHHAYAQSVRSDSILRSSFNLGVSAGLGFATLDRDSISYVYMPSSLNETRRTTSTPDISYSFSLFTDVYLDMNKTFGFGFEASFLKSGFKDKVYNEKYRLYYCVVTAKFVSWTQKNFYISAGWYYGFLLKTSGDILKDYVENLDYGVAVDIAVIRGSGREGGVLTKLGAKIYIGMKKVFKKFNDVDTRVGDIKGYNFNVNFYLSFFLGLF